MPHTPQLITMLEKAGQSKADRITAIHTQVNYRALLSKRAAVHEAAIIIEALDTGIRNTLVAMENGYTEDAEAILRDVLKTWRKG